jgi:hypothetical protein
MTTADKLIKGRLYELYSYDGYSTHLGTFEFTGMYAGILGFKDIDNSKNVVHIDDFGMYGYFYPLYENVKERVKCIIQK